MGTSDAALPMGELFAASGVEVVEGGRMAADLFGDVTHTPKRLGARRWYTLPLSIVTHAVTVVVIVVVPLATSDVLPPIHRALTHFEDIDITPVVPPPPMQRAAAPRAETPAVSRDAAPTVAPPEIGPETFPPDVPDVGGADGVPNGIPGGVSLDSATLCGSAAASGRAERANTDHPRRHATPTNRLRAARVSVDSPAEPNNRARGDRGDNRRDG